MNINFNPNSLVSHSTQRFPRTKNFDVEKESLKNVENSSSNPPHLDDEGKILINDKPFYVSNAEMLIATGIITRSNIGRNQIDVPIEVITSDFRAQQHFDSLSEFVLNLQNKVNKIQTYYEDGEKISPSGNFLRKIIYEPGTGADIMLEYREDGELLRKSEFKDGAPLYIEEYLQDGRKNILSFEGGKPAIYKEGYKELEDGQIMDRFLTFNSGAISMCFDDYEEYDDGRSESSKILWAEDGEMTAYYEDMENFCDGSSEVSLHLRYKNGEMTEYVENIINGCYFDKKYLYKDGQWVLSSNPKKISK